MAIRRRKKERRSERMRNRVSGDFFRDFVLFAVRVSFCADPGLVGDLSVLYFCLGLISYWNFRVV